MDIKSFSKKTGVSIYTIRYYEKVGILKNIERSFGGHRIFNLNDIGKVKSINRLVEMGMPLKKIKLYEDLRERGESTVFFRKMLLLEHFVFLEGKISLEIKQLKITQKKYYESMIDD